MKKLTLLFLSIVLSLTLVACSTAPSASSEVPASSTESTSSTEESSVLPTDEKPIKIKVALTGERSDPWEYVKEELAKENIDVELVFFSDYIIPNIALADGDVDLNAFQTEIFFNYYLEESNADLVNVAYTYLAPMGIYAGTKSSLEELTEGDKVSIPNDVTNGGRALILLQAAGVIELDPESGLIPTIKDITANPKNIEIIELAAPQLPTTLDEVAVAVINNGIAVTAGYSPLEDSIFIESPDQEGIENYYNIIAAKESRKNEPAIIRVLEVFQSEANKEIIISSTNGSSIPVF